MIKAVAKELMIDSLYFFEYHNFTDKTINRRYLEAPNICYIFIEIVSVGGNDLAFLWRCPSPLIGTSPLKGHLLI